MAINRITNTPIEVHVHNQRSITANHAVCKNCVRQADGTLWAVLGFYGEELHIYRSTDNGFSWSRVCENLETGEDRGEDGFNVDGHFVSLLIDERWNNIDTYIGEWETIGDDGSLYRRRYNLEDTTEARVDTQVLSTTDDPWQGGSFDVCHNAEEVFLTWIKSDGTLQTTRCSPRTAGIGYDYEEGTFVTCYGLLSNCCDKDGNVYIANVHFDDPDRVLSFVRYDNTDSAYDSPVEIENLGASPAIAKDVCIARDGYETLCVVYFDQGDEEVRYAISTDAGATWDVNTLTRTSGHAVYNDATSTDAAGRTNVIGGSQGGFIMTYVEDNSSGTPRAYVRQITTTDGSTYTLGAEQEIGTSDLYADEPIIGVQFFLPTDTKLLDISDPGQVRIAFTVGEGDTQTMTDGTPVTIGQELLSESAYPSTLTSEGSSHSLDTADSYSLRVLFNIHAGPDGNEDFYAAGFTGDYTTRYESAFKQLGTSIRLLQYEPKADNYLSDRSAYDAPTEYSALAIFSPISYSFPVPSIDASGVEEWIERDVRGIHLPPDFHLSRTFIVNKGGYLKRTVWLCEHDGNQYEISQVVPRFLNNQICYYEANAYVVGPSRDPFAREILPSET